MSKQPKNRPPFQVSLPDFASAAAAIGSLTVALQYAIEAAVFPDRVKVDGESKIGRLDAVAAQLRREAKNTLSEGVAETSDASGTTAALAIIDEIIGGIRDEI